MRNVMVIGAPLLAGVISLPMFALNFPASGRDEGRLVWRGVYGAIELDSALSNGFAVTRAGTDGTCGLRQGGVVLAVDGGGRASGAAGCSADR